MSSNGGAEPASSEQMGPIRSNALNPVQGASGSNSGVGESPTGAFLRRLTASLLVLVATATCVGPSPVVVPANSPAAAVPTTTASATSPSAAPTATPSVPRRAFQVDASVTAQDRADVERGMDLMSAYIEQNLGGDATGPITVLMTREGGSPPVPPELSGSCCGLFGRNRTIAFDVGHLAWTKPDRLALDAYHVKIAGHEYLHAWQDTLGCRYYQQSAVVPPAVSPAWIVEGMAEMLTFRMLTAAGLADPAALRQSWIGEAQFRSTVRLANFEQAAAGQSLPFGILILANELLATKGSYRAFCDGVGKGRAWRDVFASVYGMTPDAFYTEFEAWRTGGFDAGTAAQIPPRVPTSVPTIAATPTPAPRAPAPTAALVVLPGPVGVYADITSPAAFQPVTFFASGVAPGTMVTFVSLTDPSRTHPGAGTFAVRPNGSFYSLTPGTNFGGMAGVYVIRFRMEGALYDVRLTLPNIKS